MGQVDGKGVSLRRGLQALLLAAAFAGGDVWFRGAAGPYPLRVTIQTPGVIPGRASIRIVPANPEQIGEVSVQPLVWNIPATQAPAPDRASREANGDYTARLWLMVAGSYGVRITVEGTLGPGTIVVPVSAVANQRLDLAGGLGAVLLGLGLFLAAGLVTIIRSAAAESTLLPGAGPDRSSRRRGWIGLAGGSAVVALAIVGGNAWWKSVDTAYRARLYRAPRVVAAIDSATGLMRLTVRDSMWAYRRSIVPLAPDAGRVAHVFIIGRAVFAHLHPASADSNTFVVALPPLPAQEYQVVVETTDSTGFTEQLLGTARLDGGASHGPTPDGWWNAGSDGQQHCIAGGGHGCRILLGREAVVNGPGGDLAFALPEASMRIDESVTEPAEAVILGADGRIIHLRSHGTSSNAALLHFNPAVPAQPWEPGKVVFPYPASETGNAEVWASVALADRGS